MIPVYRHPYRDEHIYGWIQELAQMNRMTFRKFADVFLGGMAWDGTVDSVSGISCLDGNEDLKEIVYNNSLFPALAPYMERPQQAVSIDHLLNGGQKHIYHTTTYMKICPVCINEDTSCGIRPYYRTWHQLSEITRCAVHKVPLLRLRKRGPINEAMILSAELETEDCGDIAEKIYNLYREPRMTDCTKWHCKMTKRQRRINRASRITDSDLEWIREAEETVLLAEIPCTVCGSTFLTHPYAESRYNICRPCRERLGVEGTEEAILGIREDYRIVDGKVLHMQCGKSLCRCSPQTFLWAGKECGCKSKKGSLKIHKKAFDDSEFTVTEYLEVEGKTGRRVRIRHEVCGREFMIKPSDFSMRRYCRVCREREYGRVFIESFRAMMGDEYEVLTPEREITTTKSTVRLRHKVCGTVHNNVARNILIGQRCPFCVSKPGADKVVNTFNKFFDLNNNYRVEAEQGYIRITYPDGTARSERAALLVQEMTRLDEPSLFPGMRMKRLKPDAFYSPKAKLFIYYMKHCEKGVFRASCRNARDLGMADDQYWSGLANLEKQGKIVKTGVRGVYKFTERGYKGE